MKFVLGVKCAKWWTTWCRQFNREFQLQDLSFVISSIFLNWKVYFLFDLFPWFKKKTQVFHKGSLRAQWTSKLLKKCVVWAKPTPLSHTNMVGKKWKKWRISKSFLLFYYFNNFRSHFKQKKLFTKI